MTLWAIIPVKPLRRGRSRLSGVLSEDERAILNFTMLKNTLQTLKEVKEISDIVVISRDSAALSLAREYHTRTVKEDGSPELNLALTRVTRFAEFFSADSVLILPADLPLLNVEVIKEFLSHAEKSPEIVIASDHRQDGTNALLVNPPGGIEYCYGPGSFKLHCEQAKKKGYRLDIVSHPSLQLDLDLPEDLEILQKMESQITNHST